MPGKTPLIRKNRRFKTGRDPDNVSLDDVSSSPLRDKLFKETTQLCSSCQMDCATTNKLEDLIRELNPLSDTSSMLEDTCDHLKFFKNLAAGGRLNTIEEMKLDSTLAIETIYNNQIQLLKLLIDHGFSITGRSIVSGSTALIAAVLSSNCAMVELLLQNGADPNECDWKSCTPLMHASHSENNYIASILLQHGANMTVPPLRKQEKLSRKNHDMCNKQSRIPHGMHCPCKFTSSRRFNNNPYFDSSSNGSPVEDSSVYQNPLITSIHKRNLELFDLLYKQPNINLLNVTNGNTALVEAIKYRFDPILNLLLNNPTVLNELNTVCKITLKTALSMASKHNHLDVAERLIALGADIETGGRTPLMEACRMGHSQMIDLLLKHGANIFAQTLNKQTTMLYAADCDSPDVVEQLYTAMIDKKCCLNSIRKYCEQSDCFGRTPLMMACSNANVQIVIFLIDTFVVVNSINCCITDSGHTAFTLACESGSPEIVSLLYKKGADPLHCLNDGSNVLHKISKSGNTRMVALLDQLIDDVQTLGEDRDEYSKLLNVSSSDDYEGDDIPYNLRKSRKTTTDGLCSIVNYISPPTDLSHSSDLQFDISSEICQFDDKYFPQINDIVDCTSISLDAFANLPAGVESQNICQVHSPIKKCKMPNSIKDGAQSSEIKGSLFVSLLKQKDNSGNTPLMVAITSNDLEMVEELVLYGANLDDESDRKDTALSIASSAGYADIVKYLLDSGSKINHRNSSDYTPLSLASSAGHVSTMAVLLAAGAEVDSRGDAKFGITPCMLASLNGHYEAVELLINNKCDINCSIETNRNSALTLACYQNHPDVAEILIRNDAYLEHRAKSGFTPLMEAASLGYEKVAQVLIKYGADVNAALTTQTRDTALTLSAERGKASFVELLIKNDVQLDAKNKKGCTALWLASNGGYLPVVKMLVEAQADVYTSNNRGVSCLETAFRHGHVDVVEYLVQKVKQYPSDAVCHRVISTITNHDMLERCKKCINIIVESKKTQILEADRNADILLRQIEDEKNLNERKKEASIRKRENKKRRKIDKQLVDDNILETNQPQNDVGEFHLTDVPFKTVDPMEQFQADETLNSISSDCNNEQAMLSLKDEDFTDNINGHPFSDGEVTPNSSQTNCASYTYQLPKITDFYSPSTASSAQSDPNTVKPTSDFALDCSTLRQKKHERVKKMANFTYGDEITQEISKKSRVILVQSTLFGRIMGRGGSHMNRIREISLANIEVEQQQPGQEQRRIKLRGNVKSMKLAQQIISHIVTESHVDVLEILEYYDGESAASSFTANVKNDSVPIEDTTTHSMTSVACILDQNQIPNNESEYYILVLLRSLTTEDFGPITPFKQMFPIYINNVDDITPSKMFLQHPVATKPVRKPLKANGNSSEVSHIYHPQASVRPNHYGQMYNDPQYQYYQSVNNSMPDQSLNGGYMIPRDYIQSPQSHYSQDYFNFHNSQMMTPNNFEMYDSMYPPDYYMGNPDIWINGYHNESVHKMNGHSANPKNGYQHNGRGYYDPTMGYYERDMLSSPREMNPMWRSFNDKKGTY